MKVSKPILVTLIFAILFAGYTFIFTGKKLPGTAPPADTRATAVMPQPSRPAPSVDARKPDTSIMNLAWGDDPFLLPKSISGRKPEKPKIAPKLVAIMEGSAGRYAIISGEIVKKGDRVGDEKVADIDKDKVVLIRNNAKRVLSIEDTGH